MFFPKTKFSRKVPLERWNAFLTIGRRFIAKVRHISTFWKNSVKTFLFEKMTFLKSCFSGQIKKNNFDNLLRFFCQSPKNNHPTTEKSFWGQSFTRKRQFSVAKPSGGMESNFFKPAENFFSKFHCFKFFKRFRSIFERNYQTVNFFSEKKQSPWKSSSRQKKRILDSRLEVHCQSMTILRPGAEKKHKNISSFKKQNFPSKHSLGHRDAFSIIIQKNDKRLKFRRKFK